MMSISTQFFVAQAEETDTLLVKETHLLSFLEKNDENKGEKKKATLKDFIPAHIRDWITRGAKVDAMNGKERRVIHYLAKLDRPDLLKALLAYKPKIDAQDNEGHTALHLAAYRGNLENVRLLLKAHADTSCIGPNLWLPLHMACQQENSEIVAELLVHTKDVDRKAIDGWTAFHYAARTGSIAIGELLFKAGLDPTAETAQNDTPWTIAQTHGHSAFAFWVEQLVQERSRD